LLLNEVIAWMRRQSGTTSLRALLYMDEVFGYFPPSANPPSKMPMLTLLKQARAFGLGVVLATQNPVDLDYKALSNAGTWFVGKLQTERDKDRLVEGLEGVAAERGTLGNKAYLEAVISALGNRVFLLHNVHRGKPLLFQTRHALSFLRGPMTRDQVARLMEPFKEPGDTGAPAASPVAIPLCHRCHAELPPGAAACARCGATLDRGVLQLQDREFKQALQRKVPLSTGDTLPPSLPEDVPQVFLPVNPARPAHAAMLVYEARVLGMAEVTFIEKRRNVTIRQAFHLLVSPPTPGLALGWHLAEKIEPHFAAGPAAAARWGELPDSLNSARKLKSFEKSLANYLYDDARLTLFDNARLGSMGEPGEDLLAFRERCRNSARREAEALLAAEKLVYEPRFHALGARLPEQPQEQQGTTMLDLINPLWWLGWAGNSPPSDEVARLQKEWFEKQAAIYEQARRHGEEYTQISMRPRRQDVQVNQIVLAWVPTWR
jgi:hypothetical protein